MVSAIYSAGSIEDPDLFWHILIGDQIRSTGSLASLGADWTVTQPVTQWQTSQWASEVAVSLFHQAGGLTGLVILRTATALVLMVAIGALLLSRATPRAAVILMPLAALSVAPVVQDRPQTASLVLTVWLSWRVSGALAGGRGPSPWEVVAVTFIWAQFHGLWILVPAAFGVVTMGRVLEGRVQRPLARRAALLTLTSVLAGLLNPLGPKSLILPLQFAGNTSLIDEWSRTSLAYGGTVLLLLFLSLVGWLWSRSTVPVPRAELVHIGAWSLFAFLAIRNVAPALILMVPVVGARLSLHLPRAGSRSNREQQFLKVAIAVVLVCGSAIALTRAATVDPLAGARGVDIARTLANSDAELRVLNDYNTSGVLLYVAGNQVTLGIDGRADRLGGEYIDRYNQAENLRGQWRDYVADIDPEVAVLRSDLALTQWLEQVDGWIVVQTEGDYSLLARNQGIADDLA